MWGGEGRRVVERGISFDLLWQHVLMALGTTHPSCHIKECDSKNHQEGTVAGIAEQCSHLCEMYSLADRWNGSPTIEYKQWWCCMLTDRGSWPCRGVLGSGDVTHFRYDVAEVKLSVRDTPEWLTSLTKSGQSTADLCALPEALRSPHCCDISPSRCYCSSNTTTAAAAMQQQQPSSTHTAAAAAAQQLV